MIELQSDIKKILDFIKDTYKETTYKNFSSFYRDYKEIFTIRNKDLLKCAICDKLILDKFLIGMEIRLDNKLFYYRFNESCLDQQVRLYIMEQGISKELNL